MVYEETSDDFEIASVTNTLSGDFVAIDIRSTFKPYTNEVWLRNVKQKDEKFWLVQPMERGVEYSIKLSGQFLYKKSNELDGKNYSITKIALQGHALGIEEGARKEQDDVQ